MSKSIPQYHYLPYLITLSLQGAVDAYVVEPTKLDMITSKWLNPQVSFQCSSPSQALLAGKRKTNDSDPSNTFSSGLQSRNSSSSETGRMEQQNRSRNCLINNKYIIQRLDKYLRRN